LPVHVGSVRSWIGSRRRGCGQERLADLIQSESIVVDDDVSEAENLGFELSRYLGSASGVREEGRHLHACEVRIEPACRTIWEGEPRPIAESSGGGVFLIYSASLTARIRLVTIKIAVAASAFHYIDHAIRHGLADTVELWVNLHHRGKQGGGRIGKTG